MLQKINLINYLKIGISFIISLLFLNCGKNDYVWNAEMKVYFINEINDTIFTNLYDYTSHLNCPFPYILPMETKRYFVTQEFYGSEKSDIPTIENIKDIRIDCEFFYGRTHNCERRIRNIENYEDRKEISPLVFEFTFRFTEEKKANAESCN